MLGVLPQSLGLREFKYSQGLLEVNQQPIFAEAELVVGMNGERGLGGTLDGYGGLIHAGEHLGGAYFPKVFQSLWN